MLQVLVISGCAPTLVFRGSQANLQIAKNPIYHECTKHIEVGCHFVRDKLWDGLITLHHIFTPDQLTLSLKP